MKKLSANTVRTLRLALRVLRHPELRVTVSPFADPYITEAHAELDASYDENGHPKRGPS